MVTFQGLSQGGPSPTCPQLWRLISVAQAQPCQDWLLGPHGSGCLAPKETKVRPDSEGWINPRGLAGGDTAGCEGCYSARGGGCSYIRGRVLQMPICTHCLPCKHAPSSSPRGPRRCRGTPACRSTHSTPFPPLTPHPAGRWLTSSTVARTPHPPGGPAPAASPRRAAGVCTAKWRLCTEPESCRAALISRKHIISRNNISAPVPEPLAPPRSSGQR